jgi:hypothetical protein
VSVTDGVGFVFIALVTLHCVGDRRGQGLSLLQWWPYVVLLCRWSGLVGCVVFLFCFTQKHGDVLYFICFFALVEVSCPLKFNIKTKLQMYKFIGTKYIYM